MTVRDGPSGIHLLKYKYSSACGVYKRVARYGLDGKKAANSQGVHLSVYDKKRRAYVSYGLDGEKIILKKKKKPGR